MINDGSIKRIKVEKYISKEGNIGYKILDPYLANMESLNADNGFRIRLIKEISNNNDSIFREEEIK